MSVIYLLVFGLIFGALGRLLLPGKDPMGLLGTMAIGIVGSLIGGFLGYLIFNKDLADGAFQPAGLLGSLVGTIIALLIRRLVVRR